jgi:hypothetical protein
MADSGGSPDRGSSRRARHRLARLLRGAGLVWLGLTVLSFLAVTVVRLDTAPAQDDPWEAVAGWSSPYHPFADLGAGLLLASPGSSP